MCNIKFYNNKERFQKIWKHDKICKKNESEILITGIISFK